MKNEEKIYFLSQNVIKKKKCEEEESKFWLYLEEIKWEGNLTKKMLN